MDITPLIDNLRQDLSRAAEVGDDAVRAAADRLLMALDPAARLTLMDALSQAAAEITEALHGPVVEVRLRGRDPTFVVTGAVAPEPPALDEPPAEPFDEQADGTARITFRLPESLKVRAEELAARSGQSLNTWLVNAARAAAAGGGAGPHHRGPGGHRHRSSPRRVQGWVK